MSTANQLKDLLTRMTKQHARIMWTPDIRARRAPDQDSYVVIGGGGRFDVSPAIVSVVVPVPYAPDGFGGQPTTPTETP